MAHETGARRPRRVLLLVALAAVVLVAGGALVVNRAAPANMGVKIKLTVFGYFDGVPVIGGAGNR